MGVGPAGRPPDQAPDAKAGGGGIRWGAVAFIALILGGVWLAMEAFGPEPERITYSQFREQVRADRIDRITVKGQNVQGQYARLPDGKEGAGDLAFATHLPPFGDDDLMALLEQHGVEVEAEASSGSGWWMITGLLLPVALLLGLGWLVMRSARGQARSVFNIKRSQARLYDRRQERTTFQQVAGLEAAKADLREVIAFLKDPAAARDLGAKAPSGVLLMGPPETGKTLLARAVAGEAEVPFFSITGSDFMEMFVGVGASRVRSMFEEARGVAPAIVFIDELDSIGRRRGSGLGGGHDEREQTLNQLLSELDGFVPHQAIVVMAATNRPDILDPALQRPGRFDRQVVVDLPTLKERRAILGLHAEDKPLAPEVELDRLARATPGFSGADLENLLNEAALLAARDEAERIRPKHLDTALDRVVMGRQREGLVLSDRERRLIAYHESGHAVIAALLPRADPVHKVTVVPHGKAMGATQQLPERDRYLLTRQDLEARLAVLLAGRAAEQVFLDATSTGAGDDLKQATRLARRMVHRWGMGERFGHVAFEQQRDHVFLGEEIGRGRQHSERTARELDGEVQRLLDRAYDTARLSLQQNRTGVEALIERLEEIEELSGAEVEAILEAHGAQEMQTTFRTGS